jgi:bacterioferritin
MKGNDRLLSVLNELLADELTAISQYMVHSEMCTLVTPGLHQAIEKQAIDEMHHAEWLISACLRRAGRSSVEPMAGLDEADHRA